MNSRKAFEDRHKFFRKECKAKGKQAANDFNARLSRKGHAGKLEFDHDNETLKLSVTRNSQDENSASTSDARNVRRPPLRRPVARSHLLCPILMGVLCPLVPSAALRRRALLHNPLI